MHINEKLLAIKSKIKKNEPIKIGIIGAGSVGMYLLSYLLDSKEDIEIHVVGRNEEKIKSGINISKVASSIRGYTEKNVKFIKVDLDEIHEIESYFESYTPDIIVNTSRAYSGVKYGKISWNAIHAYGIWTPLSVKYLKNIMEAHTKVNCKSIVINTSYSDAANKWVGTSGINGPDFGSGNLNHLIPRIKFAVRDSLNLSYSDKIDVHIATSHFHNVVISKSGNPTPYPPLLKIFVNDEELDICTDHIYKQCAIVMPTDHTRNQMNASSNYDIISTIINSLRTETDGLFHSPGPLNLIGGYPVKIDGENASCSISNSFEIEDMKETNRHSIYLDGIENVENGTLTYTSELIEKVKKEFNVKLPKEVKLNDSNKVADLLIEKIIKKYAVS